MVLARVAELLSSDSSSKSDGSLIQSKKHGYATEVEVERNSQVWEAEEQEEEARPPYVHAMLAGGFGGLTGDMLMHSLDTVKTRQQGDPSRPPKYRSLGTTYVTIFRQEGIARGLYGGVLPAALGSFAGTSLFFGAYEWSKRTMIDFGVAPSIAYFSAGIVADLVASPLYVPSEVLKTRLQLQGRYNNPHFHSGYNYSSMMNAARTITRTEGAAALFHGYQATLFRDLPFSALTFVFYEKEREAAKYWMGSSNIGLPLEILTGATAGGMAGTLSCPLDVVKTRLQTQLPSSSKVEQATKNQQPNHRPSGTTSQLISTSATQRRPISTSSPPSSMRPPGSVNLATSSVFTGLKLIYKSEGLGGWFRGVGPRAVWTSIQSATMLVLYQVLLRKLEYYLPLSEPD